MGPCFPLHSDLSFWTRAFQSNLTRWPNRPGPPTPSSLTPSAPALALILASGHSEHCLPSEPWHLPCSAWRYPQLCAWLVCLIIQVLPQTSPPGRGLPLDNYLCRSCPAPRTLLLFPIYFPHSTCHHLTLLLMFIISFSSLGHRLQDSRGLAHRIHGYILSSYLVQSYTRLALRVSLNKKKLNEGQSKTQHQRQYGASNGLTAALNIVGMLHLHWTFSTKGNCK